MIELGELEANHAEFDKRQAKVLAISLENQAAAKETQADFPHLTIVSDAERGVSNALEVIQPQSDPEGGDTSAPTTILLDGNGVVRWTFRPDRVTRRLSPREVLTALDEKVVGR